MEAKADWSDDPCENNLDSDPVEHGSRNDWKSISISFTTSSVIDNAMLCIPKACLFSQARVYELISRDT